MAEEDVDNLPPEEKIKRLKELEKKKKKEIEEAQKMLRETEKELTEREEWKRKVPIPQVAAESMGEMSEAEKEIIRAHKGLKEVEVLIEEVNLKDRLPFWHNNPVLQFIVILITHNSYHIGQIMILKNILKTQT